MSGFCEHVTGLATEVTWFDFWQARDLFLFFKLYRIKILPVVWYGCETWSLTLREKRRLGVFENRVLMRIFGPKRDEVTGEWMKLHKEELNGLYRSPSIVQVIKARRMRWAWHVARMGRGEMHTGFWWGYLNKRDHLEDPGVDGRIVLRWIFRKWDVGDGLDRDGLG